MPGHYFTLCRVRPHFVGCERDALRSARFYLCARCRTQVLICSSCDRGQIYCSGRCAQEARRSKQRAANKRFQDSRRGRVKHAARARRYRARKKKVTYQASLQQRSDGLVSPISAPIGKPSTCGRIRRRLAWRYRCRRCGHRCLPFVRLGFLRRGRVPQAAQRRRDSVRDHFP